MSQPEPRPPRQPELDEVTRARAARGDQRAFRQLVERYQRPVFDLLWRMLDSSGRADRVEDLTQETFVRVFGALGRFDPGGAAKLSTWILTIATRLALNDLRGARPTVPLDSVAEQLATAGDGHRRHQLGRALARAIGELAPDYRAALVLREYHGLDYAEIAGVLEVDLGTVKSRLSRARAQLREQLQEIRHV